MASCLGMAAKVREGEWVLTKVKFVDWARERIIEADMLDEELYV